MQLDGNHGVGQSCGGLCAGQKGTGERKMAEENRTVEEGDLMLVVASLAHLRSWSKPSCTMCTQAHCLRMLFVHLPCHAQKANASDFVSIFDCNFMGLKAGVMFVTAAS